MEGLALTPNPVDLAEPHSGGTGWGPCLGRGWVTVNAQILGFLAPIPLFAFPKPRKMKGKAV